MVCWDSGNSPAPVETPCMECGGSGEGDVSPEAIERHTAWADGEVAKLEARWAANRAARQQKEARNAA